MTWYEKSFGSSYLERYAHRDAREAERDARAIVALIEPDRDAPLLDLGCGAGRHLIALRRLGFRSLVGLDLSTELLREAKRSLVQEGDESIRLVCGDMREIPYDNYFATVLSLFNTFGYFASDEENERVVLSVFQALRSEGVFLLDYFNRGHVVANYIPEDEQVISGLRVRNVRSLTGGERRIEKRMTIVREGEEPVELLESVRLFSRDELVTVFSSAGFEGIECFGSLEGEMFNKTSGRLIMIGKKKR